MNSQITIKTTVALTIFGFLSVFSEAVLAQYNLTSSSRTQIDEPIITTISSSTIRGTITETREMSTEPLPSNVNGLSDFIECNDPRTSASITYTISANYNKTEGDSFEILAGIAAETDFGLGNLLSVQLGATAREYLDVSTVSGLSNDRDRNIVPLICFDQYVRGRYEVKSLKLEGERRPWTRIINPFVWGENTWIPIEEELLVKKTLTNFVIEAKYRESCNSCAISGKPRVLGSNNEPLHAKIPDGNDTYNVPIFWDEEGREHYEAPPIQKVDPIDFPSISIPPQ